MNSSKLTSVNSPCDHQKIYGFLMISRGTEVTYIHLNSLNIRSKIWRRTLNIPCFDLSGPRHFGALIVQYHCAESVRIRSFSGPHFPALGLNMKRYESECGKIRTRKNPNTDTFYAVFWSEKIFKKSLERMIYRMITELLVHKNLLEKFLRRIHSMFLFLVFERFSIYK